MRPVTLMSSQVLRLALIVTSSVTAAVGCGQEPDVDSAAALLLGTDGSLASPKIVRISASGAGCPDPSEFVTTEDLNDFSAELANYVVTVAPGSATEAIVGCSLSISLDGPAGVRYAPAGLDVDLSTDSTSSVTLSTNARWTSAPDLYVRTDARIASRGWRTTQTVLDEEQLWSACSGARELHVETQLSLTTSAGRRGYASVHELGNLRFRSERCDTTGSDADAGAIDAGSTASADAAVAPPDASTPVDPSTTFQVTNVKATGSGCPPDFTTVKISADGKTFDVNTHRFIADNDERSLAYERCGFWIDIAAPPGYRAVLDSFVVDGQMQLASGTNVRLNSAYWYSQPTLSKDSSLHFAGEKHGPFSAEVTLGSVGAGLSSCSPNLTAEMTVFSSLTSSRGPVMIDIRRIHAWKFRLERC